MLRINVTWSYGARNFEDKKLVNASLKDNFKIKLPGQYFYDILYKKIHAFVEVAARVSF